MMCSQYRIRKLWIPLSVHLVYHTEAHAKGLVERCQPDYLAQNVYYKERSRFRLENFRSARCSLSEFFKVLAARKTYLITARARKNKRTARMLACARKDHSIPL